jgi:hypothetical protein
LKVLKVAQEERRKKERHFASNYERILTRIFYALLSIKNATRLGVEPRTFRLTAECSNQLSYPVKRFLGKSVQKRLFLEKACKNGFFSKRPRGIQGIEPWTSKTQTLNHTTRPNPQGFFFSFFFYLFPFILLFFYPFISFLFF